jgi:hypothetical protein
MMDAIGNTLQGATAIRGASQQSVGQTAQPEADPLAGAATEPSRYYSPVVRLDSETQRTVLQFRDGSDGKVLVQYPSERQLEAYRSQANAERAKDQEKANALISGDKDAAGGTGQTGARQTGTGQQAGSPIAGQSKDEAGSAGATPSTSPMTQSPPISIPVSTPRAVSSAPDSSGAAIGGTGRPVLQSISA